MTATLSHYVTPAGFTCPPVLVVAGDKALLDIARASRPQSLGASKVHMPFCRRGWLSPPLLPLPMKALKARSLVETSDF